MAVVSMKELLEAGVHFGHITRRRNPKMEKYIFAERNGIHIIDLKKTVEQIEIAYKALFEIVQEGGKVLFVGTKKQAQDAVFEEAERTGQYYVNQRWLGGTLTNFDEIRKRTRYLKGLYLKEESGGFDSLTKKEVINILRERGGLEKRLSGIKEMEQLPSAIFIVDPKEEINAIKEARKIGIPVFGIVDTNCDPDEVDYVIPANDDAIRAVKLITNVLGNAIIEAQGGVVEKYEDEEESFDYGEKERKPKTKLKQQGYQSYDESVHEEIKAEEVKAEEPKVETEEKPKEVKAEEPKVEAEESSEEAKVEEAEVEAGETEIEPAEADIDLESLKVVELRELAKEKEIPNYSTLRKAELIEALKK